MTNSSSRNPVVFLDLLVGPRPLGRLVFELFADVTPKTAENFRSLCTGERGDSLHFLNSCFHRVISGFMAQGGDITRGDGTGGMSIFGEKFPDENFLLSHDSAGLLSMANSGPDTNSSQFFITFRDTPHLDGRHVVFGKLKEGMEVLKVLENVSTDNSDRPRAEVTVANCGQLGQVVDEEESQKESQKESQQNEDVPGSGVEKLSDGEDEVKRDDEKEEEEQTEEQIQEQLAGMTPAQQRLFKLRLKINQGRKLNKTETEKEYKRMTDPNFAKREKAAERRQRQEEYSSDLQSKGYRSSESYMLQTAGESEQQQMKKAAKDRNRATFGWEAFTSEADYKAYNKRLTKLPGAVATESNNSAANAIHYGKKGTEISKNGLDRMVKEIEGQEEQRKKYSRRRAAHEGTTVDHINDKNEFFNKKIKRSFDKYTVEIRQNLERGTAL